MKARRFRKRKGRCYELAWRYLLEDDDFADWELVHGEARGPDGLRIGHAWLERGEETFDPVLNQHYPTPHYRMRFEATPIKKFTKQEAAITAVQNGHFGPWH